MDHFGFILLKAITKGNSERNEIQRHKVEVAKMKEDNKILFADLNSITNHVSHAYIESRKKKLRKQAQTSQSNEHEEGVQYQYHGSQYQT